MKPTLQIDCFASGSAANCFRVSDGQTNLLLECGLPFAKLKEKLDFKLSTIDACLITHGHMDHAKSAKHLIAAGIDVYCSAGTAQEVDIGGYRVKRVRAKEPFSVGTFKGIAFDTMHDSKEPLGYVLKSTITNESLLFITDSYYVPVRFKNLNYIMVECNYLSEWLLSMDMDDTLRKRLMRSHMSLETCIKFLQAQDLSIVKRIYLTHLSSERADAPIMLREVRRATGKDVTVCDPNSMR